MKTNRERILLVESNPDIRDLIARQTLEQVGYQVDSAPSAGAAIQFLSRATPDMIILNMHLSDLSGKDLLVALNAQGVDAPVLLITQRGAEVEAVQAFRLGAADYISWPAREAEIVSAVERVLKQVRARRDRDNLERQLKQTNEELNRRVRELTTIFAIGKAVTSITRQTELLEKIVEGSIFISETDLGWAVLRGDHDKLYRLAAQRGLPKNEAVIGQPWDDGVGSLVVLSGESLAIAGEPLQRFRLARYGKSALVVPLKIKKEVVGLLVMVRRSERPYTTGDTKLLEAVADYASISLANARLFQTMEERARIQQQAAEKAQVNERRKDEILQNLEQNLGAPLSGAFKAIDALLVDEAHLNSTQRTLARSVREQLQKLAIALKALRESGPRT